MTLDDILKLWRASRLSGSETVRDLALAHADENCRQSGKRPCPPITTLTKGENP